MKSVKHGAGVYVLCTIVIRETRHTLCNILRYQPEDILLFFSILIIAVVVMLCSAMAYIRDH
jgi:hypothetical protein